MLPTTGFFKNIDCPFYESSCERPYCHFKHRKKTQEPAEVINPVPPEIPTYNPTPKSQLANSRSHIPISYVPDLAIRTERNFRSLSSSYGYSGCDKPTYNPTPLSILSTGKINSIKSNENTNYNPTAISSEDEEDSKAEVAHEHDSNDINFEELENEFDMIDEIISDSGADNEVNGESKDVKDEAILKNDKLTTNENNKVVSNETIKLKHKNSSASSSSSNHKSKHNGKVKESSSKSKSNDKKSKHRSHSSSSSSHKKESSSSSSRSESKHTNDKRDSKSSKSSSKDDRKRRSRSKEKKKESSKSESSRDRKHESKDKHKQKESSRHSYKSTKERDKEKKNEEKKKHKESSKIEDKLKERIEEKLETSPDEFDYEELNYDNEDSDAEEDTLEECYKIFTEYKPTEPELFPELKRQETNLDENSTMLNFNKKRIAHENADRMNSKTLFNKPKYVPSAAQMMVNRLKAARLAHANNEQNNIMTEVNKYVPKRPSETVLNDNAKILKTSINTKVTTAAKPAVSKPSTSTSLIDDIISGKSTTSKPRRIAPVQNVDSIQRAKAKLQEMAKIKAINAAKTTTQSVIKGARRTAHVPEISVADVPDVLEAERSKLPVNVRSRFLTMILDECIKLYLSKEEAQQRALNEEYKCYERCAALVTYRNSAMLAINRLRKELQEREINGLGPIFPGEISDSSKNNSNDLQGRKFYENIRRFILSDEELVMHGFPREGKLPGRAVIKTQKHVSKGYLEENDRICCRCLKLYKVDEEGFAIYEEECLYHPLKKRTFRGESIYLCCRSGEETGCVTAATHVCETMNSNYGEIEGYQTTMPPDRNEDPRSYEVFALDCEMCYTTKGLELTRVTIVNSELKTVYETLVKPLNAIIDYNTRFSGITEEQMNRTATSILQVQANILHLCNSNTILIGHSLESDMKALKIIHNTIVDTSVLFPHKFGLPHKRALRDLAREYLKKIIQNDISGHDSAEDALTCMELVQWKIKEELKTRGIKV